jgi:hypothetical protein
MYRARGSVTCDRATAAASGALAGHPAAVTVTVPLTHWKEATP